MSIGLYDVDFFKYHQIMFNLELMKMATYFKGKKEITLLSPTYSPERYSHFYLRQDYYDMSFPEKLSTHKNLTYGGLAFTRGKYVPLEEEIERQKADVHIYDRYKDLFFENLKTHKAAFTNLTNNFHLRISLDGRIVWKDFERQLPDGRSTIVFFHDFNLGNIKDDKETVKYVLQRCSKTDKPAHIGTKFPIMVNSLSDYYFWNQFVFTSYFFSMSINRFFEDDEFCALIKLTPRAKLEKTNYIISNGVKSKEEFVNKVMPKILKQVIYCAGQNKTINLKIGEEKLLLEKEWYEIIDFFNMYLRGNYELAQKFSSREPDALYRFCRRIKDEDRLTRGYFKNFPLSLERARELFLFIHEKQPELFELLYECNKVKLVNGRLENDTELRKN